MEDERLPLTQHAVIRSKERKIPEALITEAIRAGHRVLLLDRNSVKYTLKNVLGIRGANLIVIVGNDDKVITSYIEKVTQKPH